MTIFSLLAKAVLKHVFKLLVSKHCYLPLCGLKIIFATEGIIEFGKNIKRHQLVIFNSNYPSSQ
jgi:hypothetical protein